MTYEVFKRELYQNVLKYAKNGGRMAKLLEKGKLCDDVRIFQAIRIMNLSAGEGAGEKGEGGYSGHLFENYPVNSPGEAFYEKESMVQDDMLFVMAEGLGHASIMHWKVRDLYERFKREGWQSVLPEIVMKLQKMQTVNTHFSFDTNSYENNCDRLIVRMLNFSGRKEELENCVYWQFGDMALVLYAVIYDMEPDFMSMKITRDMMAAWNISGTEALTNALLNTFQKMPPRLFLGTDIRCSYEPEEGVFMKGEGGKGPEIDLEDSEEGLRGYRLTTNRWLNGAVALFYPGVKERLAEIFNGDYYVGFTSIHEAVIHPVRYKVLGEMKAAIQHTNAVFDRREMLTNQVYRYCQARGELLEV